MFGEIVYLEYDKLNDKPIFTEESIKNCKNILTKLLREIMVKENITLKNFIEKHDSYMRSINAPASKSNYMKNNILKVLLKKDEMTFRLFSYIVTNILKKNITSISLNLVDGKGNEVKYETKCTL